jgi:uncharacterized protein with PIN domain
MEIVDCPKCDGKMVPLSEIVQEKVGSVKVAPYAEWRCIKCGHSISRPRTYG